MKITQTVAAFSTVAILIAGPTAFAEQQEGTGGMQSGGSQESQGAPSTGGAAGGAEAPSDAMGGSAAGGAEALSSDQIREAQQALKEKGHDVGAVDGVLGPQTQNALKEFQKAQGMQASGELDSQTLSALGVSGGAVGAPGAGEQPAPDAGGAPSGGGATEDAGPGAATPSPDAGGAPGGGGTSEDAGPGAASGGRGY